MTLVGSVGRWHGKMPERDHEQQVRELETAVVRMLAEISDRRNVLAAYRKQLRSLRRAAATTKRKETPK